MALRQLLLFLLCLAATPVQASLPETVTVELFEAHQPISEIRLRGPLRIANSAIKIPAGSYVRIFARQKQLLLQVDGRPSVSSAQKLLRLQAESISGIEATVKGIQPRRYKGKLEILLAKGGGLRVCNQVSCLDYVTATVGSETLPGWTDEVLKAQAVLTQTGLLRYKPGDKLGDSTNKEAYLGCAYERPGIRNCVLQVWGRWLAYKGSAITPYYHSTCGGGTSSSVNMLPEALPYLQAVDCRFCRRSPFWPVKQSEIPQDVFTRAISGIPELVESNQQGRPLLWRLPNNTLLSGYQLWLRLGQKLGWDKVPGTRYRIDSTASSAFRRIRIESNGAGHGLGLCQWGAAQLANEGKSYKQILRYYFPQTQVR